MTDNESGDRPDAQADRPVAGETPGERRSVARERAREARVRRRRRQSTLRWGLIGGGGVLAVALVVAIVLAVSSSVPPSGSRPANLVGDGIRVGQTTSASPADSATATDSATPTGSTSSTSVSADTVQIDFYYDYLCPLCAQFEKTNASYIDGLVKSGAATIEFHPLATLTNQSLGSKYSQRAANASACVANYSPKSFFAATRVLFAAQPAAGTSGLTDDELVTLVRGVDGLLDPSRVATCIRQQTYQSWVVAATDRAVAGPLPDTSVRKVTTQPLVLVNGQRYTFTTPFRTAEFSQFVVTAAGNSFADTATRSPTATATPGTSPTP